MSATFDTLEAADRLQDAGMDPKHAKAVVNEIRAAQSALVTTGHLAALEARLYRALWLQAAGIIGTITALAGIAIGLASLWSGQ